MKKKDLILKWLNHEPLSESESQAFSELSASDSLSKISETAKKFNAPKFDVEENLKTLTDTVATSSPKIRKSRAHHRSWIFRVAAIFIIGFGLFYILSESEKTTIATSVAEKKTIELPDKSTVIVNSLSSINYQSKNWNTNRYLYLKGEAYFKVAKGKKFDVKTSAGVVSVLGTEFNVESRESYFEVTCYEGMVSVEYDGNEIKLPAGNSIKIIDDKVRKELTKSSNPDWTHDISSFKSMPLHFVLEEFERQYDLKIITKNIDRNKVFTGNFVHSDLQSALESITIPMRLHYLIDNNVITLTKE